MTSPEEEKGGKNWIKEEKALEKRKKGGTWIKEEELWKEDKGQYCGRG
jgi:hypothetical protein